MTDELIPTKKLYPDGTSRFRRWPILFDDDQEFFATYYSHEYPYSAEDKYHEVGSGEEGRLDLIAHEYYGSALLWWVVAEANEIFHPFKDVVSGKVLRIPSTNYVFGTRLA